MRESEVHKCWYGVSHKRMRKACMLLIRGAYMCSVACIHDGGELVVTVRQACTRVHTHESDCGTCSACAALL